MLCVGRKSMAAEFSVAHAEAAASDPTVLTSGFVTVVPARRHQTWVCRTCFDDFADEFGWILGD